MNVYILCTLGPIGNHFRNLKAPSMNVHVHTRILYSFSLSWYFAKEVFLPHRVAFYFHKGYRKYRIHALIVYVQIYLEQGCVKFAQVSMEAAHTKTDEPVDDVTTSGAIQTRSARTVVDVRWNESAMNL